MYIRYDDYSYADEDVAADYDYHFYVNSRLVSKNDNTWNFTTLRSETSIYKYPTVKSLILYDGKAKSFIQSAASVSGDQTVYYGVSTSQNSQPTNWYSDIDDLKVTATGEYYLWIKTDGNKTYKALSPTRCDKITVSNQASTFENYYFGNSDGTQSNPFVISDEEDWDFLCEALNYNDIFNRFSGKYFKLNNNITVSTMAGSSNHDFCGNFDGNNKTITFNGGNVSIDGAALFSYISNADDIAVTIKNLNVVTNITSSGTHTSGLVGRFWGELNIENCTVSGTINTSNKYACGFIGEENGMAHITNCVSSITVNSSISGDGTHGGFIGRTMKNTNCYIEGCIFNGKILTTNGTDRCSGFVGWHGGSTLEIKDSLYAPATLASDETWALSDSSATFARNGGTFTNCYYMSDFNDGTNFTAQGKQARSITKGDYVTQLNFSGMATAYNKSNITKYSNNSGIKYNDTFYAGSGDTVNLTLSHSNKTGYTFKNYTASAGTLNGTTLTMPNTNVVINTAWEINKYTVTWKNYDGTVLETDTNVPYGTTPTYNSATPTKASTSQYIYTFSGWSPSVSGVTGNTTYTAQFSEALNKYTVTWKNHDGTTLETDTNVVGGTIPEYNGETPTKDADDFYTYTFKGWDKTVTAVTGNVTYTAVYTKTPKNPITLTVCDDTRKNNSFPYFSEWNDSTTGSEQIYPSTMLADIANKELYSLTFYSSDDVETNVKGMQVYLAKVDYTTVTRWVDIP